MTGSNAEISPPLSTENKSPITTVKEPSLKKNYWILIIFLIVLLVGTTAILGISLGYYLASSEQEPVIQGNTNSTLTATPSIEIPSTLATSPTVSATSIENDEQTYFGIITNLDNNKLTLLKKRLVSHNDVDYETYCGKEDDCPNGYYIIDLNESITLPLSADIQINVINIPAKECALNDDISPIQMSLSSFLNNQCQFFGPDGQRMEIKTSKGLVTEIKQIFFP